MYLYYLLLKSYSLKQAYSLKHFWSGRIERNFEKAVEFKDSSCR